jgi:hypothetical protein
MVWTSLFGIVTIILLARALGFSRAPKLHDASEAARLASDALPGFHPDAVGLATDGRGALVAGQDGRVALVRPFGDRWVVRVVNGARTAIVDQRLRLTSAEPMFPPVELALGPAAAQWASRL